MEGVIKEIGKEKDSKDTLIRNEEVKLSLVSTENPLKTMRIHVRRYNPRTTNKSTAFFTLAMKKVKRKLRKQFHLK